MGRLHLLRVPPPDDARETEKKVTTMDATTGMRGVHVVVDGEDLTVEDTVMAAVCDGRLSPDLLDHGFDTYWCVTKDGHHRLLRASELVRSR